ncbi:MAG: class I SAM-dependent RNA methyltransferase [Acidobacteriota bacterium]|nr:class I SAM-dependent RNA methyltransferase [Acidobacteriota bacterium]
MSQELKIEKLVYGGDGLSRVDGEVVFTPFVLPGETVETERSGARKQAQRARLLKVSEPSADRVVPECPYFGRCGGCHYQHASYDAQVRLKREILSETLRRVGRIEFGPDQITAVPSEPFGYRNRVQFHFENGRFGYLEANSRKLVPIDRCPISSPKINEIITTLNRMVRDPRWPRFLTSLEVFTDERQVQWNVLETERPVAKHFFEWLLEEVPGTVLGPLEYAVNGDLYTVSGPAFFQVNRRLLHHLADIAIGEASGSTAWDLYAGVGLFSLPLARRFEKVTAVESGRSAAADLERNARRARLGIKVVQESAEAFLTEAKVAPDFVLLDPPRAGLEKAVTARLLELRPKELAIVACDPATLARDLAALAPGYKIERITMVDLFPQTFHIEAAAHLVYSEGSTAQATI